MLLKCCVRFAAKLLLFLVLSSSVYANYASRFYGYDDYIAADVNQGNFPYNNNQGYRKDNVAKRQQPADLQFPQPLKVGGPSGFDNGFKFEPGYRHPPPAPEVPHGGFHQGDYHWHEHNHDDGHGPSRKYGYGSLHEFRHHGHGYHHSSHGRRHGPGHKHQHGRGHAGCRRPHPNFEPGPNYENSHEDSESEFSPSITKLPEGSDAGKPTSPESSSTTMRQIPALQTGISSIIPTTTPQVISIQPTPVTTSTDLPIVPITTSTTVEDVTYDIDLRREFEKTTNRKRRQILPNLF
ncbi:uncharacterized protein LOC131436205 isoform X2 [Malaya genurostris]|uniref:uncharacterized protein LOC131436205 isoform X2 n=1 Tax=Malaya genurostris TaxID=325434 RepID=UPI0026F3BDAB|nr:uncharacterized protein LOC131436205 isoform X2 [Malaya genurostris]